jgi:hypothetical protein
MSASQPTLDDYEEREMFTASFPLVAAFPVPEAMTAVMPRRVPLADPDVVRRELGNPAAGHALRRRSTAEPWSGDNTVIVPIPDELRAAHAVEAADIVADPPARSPLPRRRYTLAPMAEYNAASVAVLRGRIEFDAIKWATAIGCITARSMIQLVEVTHDWCPWTPMLRVAMTLRDFDPEHIEFRAAEHRLRLVARRLLDAQGFGTVRVDDTLAHQPPLGRAVEAMLGR